MPSPTPEILDPSRYASLGELLEDARLTFKSESALVEVDRQREKRRLRYIDVHTEVMRLAAFLAERGVGPDTRVAILMSNQARWLIGASAILHLGGVIVPLDYKLGPEEQRVLLEHSKAGALLTEHGMLRRFEALDVPLVVVSEAPGDAAYPGEVVRWESIDEGPERIPPPLAPRTREDLASIVYSSGTGGRPKGCMLEHGAYLSQLAALMRLFPMRPGHRYFSILPTNHAIDFMVGFVGPFTCGAMVLHQRTLRPETILPTMKAYEITHMAVVPMLLAAFEDKLAEGMKSQPRWLRRGFDLLGGVNETLTRDRPKPALSRALLAPIHRAFGGHLELLFCGGAFVDRRRAELFYRLGLPVVIGYGLTEACTVATVNDLAPFRGDSVGAPVEGMEVHIHEPGPDGVGEVWLRGPTLMRGYLDDPELTAATLDEEGWLHTGDLGWLDASYHLHLVGRSKNMIVTAGGKNVYPEDVEAAFEGLACEELAVFASGYLWPRRARLEDEHLVAVLRPRKGNGVAAPSLDSLVLELRERNRRLPDFKRVRSVLPWTEPFPRTASMKVKRDRLADSLRADADEANLRSIG